MLFSPLHKRFFGTEHGAYSRVTNNEREKSQITITESDGESQIVIDVLGEKNIPRERIDGKYSNVILRHPNGKMSPANLAINFPKKKGRELRIYRNTEQQFAYNAGDIWYVFENGGNLHVGAMPESQWRALLRPSQESDDTEFQKAANKKEDRLFNAIINGRKYHLNPRLTADALERADYRCEFAPDGLHFTAAATGNPYLEGHHLIPLDSTEELGGKSLDFLDNIVALSPYWHRAIHHGETTFVREILAKLFPPRQELLAAQGFDLSFDDLLVRYACEEIAVRVSEEEKD